MNKFYRKRNILFVSAFICISHLVVAQTITINTATVLTSFNPGLIYGNNLNPAGPGDTNDITAVYDSITSASRPYNLQHANMLIRYGGGNPMNYYHWNSTGSYDSNNYWVPSTTAYTPGFLCAPLYKGTTAATISNGTPSTALGQYSNITDGNTTTQWRSLPSLTTPQWVYTQFVGSNQNVNGVQIVWGSTYATHYLIQYYIGTTYTAPYEDSASISWQTVATITNGTGGIDNRTFGSTYKKKFWRIYMTASSGQGYSIAELYLKDTSTVETTNTPSETLQTPTWASSMDPASMNPHISIKPDEDFDFVTFMTWCNAIGAQPILIVNTGTGTPHEAANWVRFAKNKGYNCKYWDIGNEMDGDWSCGGPIGINDYTTRYIQFADSMKAVDPTINICGPVMGINQNGLSKSILSYVPTSFLNNLKAAGKTSDCNVLSVHDFPNESPIDTLFNSVNYWNSWLPTIRNTIQADYGSANGIPVFASAYTTAGASAVDDELVGGLWSSDYLMSFVKNTGNGAALYCVIGQLFNDEGDSSWGDFGCMEDGELSAPYRYQPRATYWGFYMLNNYFSIPGTGNNLVSAVVTSAPKLDVYANTRTDNKTALFVVNRDSLNAVTATINISGFTPSSSANVYTFSAKNYLWHANSSSSYANPDNPPTDSTITTGSSFSAKFPAYSMSVIVLSPQSIVLPVQLLSFTATPEVSQVNLAWTTATETNNALFTIERSDDAENWQTVTTHPGAGNSTQPVSYTAVDKTPFSGQSYYRLKQTDYDGNFTYSGIRPVTFTQPAWQMLLYPNPASTQLTLSYQLSASQNGIFQLYNTLGQLIKSTLLNTTQGTMREDVSTIPNGIYYYTLTVNGETQVTDKVVVIH